MIKYQQMLGKEDHDDRTLYGDKPYLPSSGVDPSLLVIKAFFNKPVPYPTITCVWIAIDTNEVAPDNYELGKLNMNNPMWGLKKGILKILNVRFICSLILTCNSCLFSLFFFSFFFPISSPPTSGLPPSRSLLLKRQYLYQDLGQLVHIVLVFGVQMMKMERRAKN